MTLSIGQFQNISILTSQRPQNIRMLKPKQIETELSRLRTRKAPGIDHVSPLMMKELSRKGIVLLAYLFNAILRLQYWPKQLK